MLRSQGTARAARALPPDKMQRPWERTADSPAAVGVTPSLRRVLCVIALAAFAGGVSAPASQAQAADPLSITGVSPDRYFSPDADGQDDTAFLSYQLSAGARTTLAIKNGAGTGVRTLESAAHPPAGTVALQWDGRSTGGTGVADGVY